MGTGCGRLGARGEKSWGKVWDVRDKRAVKKVGAKFGIRDKRAVKKKLGKIFGVQGEGEFFRSREKDTGFLTHKKVEK